MAWIEVIDEKAAEGKLSEQYEKLASPEGEVDNILKIHSLSPQSLDDHYRLYRTLMYGRSPLSRAQREMIAVVVSAANQCHY